MYVGVAPGRASDGFGNQVNNFSTTTCAPTRASCAPRQKCMPVPKATCGLGARARSIRSGLWKRAGSAFADAGIGMRISPRHSARPWNSRSRRTYRSLATWTG